MGLFKEEEVLDLTKLQKRGILDGSGKLEKSDTNNEGYVDYSSRESDASAGSSSTPNSLSFLDSLAGAGSAPSSTLTSSMGADDLQHLKVKFEDLEYKIDRFMERLDKIEEKLKGS